MSHTQESVIVVGAGLAGLVAAYEAVKGGKHVIILEQENRANLGGQAFWSLGGLFHVDSPEQKLMRVHDLESSRGATGRIPQTTTTRSTIRGHARGAASTCASPRTRNAIT
ncbi:FAD-dependent oxidoreductase [Corynebacterium phoceense]|uniref:FAD-dependent oxidoreductase n=1 Tax=Corynebacterium phoceense TaxID=1686286 RepID=UPI001DB95AEB|nr:FAD-dependent oxidoreductase [Corynebacterium phoceense]HJG42463.1 FAD-dependent oxidoreductase [Corynebacterium phoceense]